MAETPVRGPERLRRALLGGYPLLYVVSWEEGRVERAVQALAQKFYEKPVAYSVWTCVDGLVGGGGDRKPDTTDPIKALDAILADPAPGFVLMKDLTAHLPRPEVTRRLRDAYRALKGRGRFLILVSPRLVVPTTSGRRSTSSTSTCRTRPRSSSFSATSANATSGRRGSPRPTRRSSRWPSRG